MTKTIDLRSDTVTKPTLEMRRAMADAEVGDDCYGEDPTVNELQALAAEKVGMEAALYVPSGTMGNQIAVKLHTRPGEEVITEERGHIFNFEMAGMAALSGVLARPLHAEDGILDVSSIRKAVRPKMYSRPRTGLIALENTHNFAGGSVYSIAQSREILDFSRESGIPVHLDGARIFNAATALGCDVKELTRGFPSVMFCLSKGLCAPVGSVLCGSGDFVDRARSQRKLLGGAMRQAGILAAAGLVALEKMVDRLGEDHANARMIAEQLSRIDGIFIDPMKVRTNILFFEITRTGLSARQLVATLAERGVLAGPVDSSRVRMLTHHDVSRDDCLAACRAIREVMDGG